MAEYNDSLLGTAGLDIAARTPTETVDAWDWSTTLAVPYGYTSTAGGQLLLDGTGRAQVHRTAAGSGQTWYSPDQAFDANLVQFYADFVGNDTVGGQSVQIQMLLVDETGTGLYLDIYNLGGGAWEMYGYHSGLTATGAEDFSLSLTADVVGVSVILFRNGTNWGINVSGSPFWTGTSATVPTVLPIIGARSNGSGIEGLDYYINRMEIEDDTVVTPPPPPPVPPAVYRDTFDDTNGTVLEDHTPSGGGSGFQWTRTSGPAGTALVIEGNEARVTRLGAGTGSANYRPTLSSDPADLIPVPADFTATFRARNGEEVGFTPSVAFWIYTSTLYVECYLEPQSGGGAVYFVYVGNGVDNDAADSLALPGFVDPVEFQISRTGTAWTVRVDGTVVLTTTELADPEVLSEVLLVASYSGADGLRLPAVEFFELDSAGTGGDPEPEPPTDPIRTVATSALLRGLPAPLVLPPAASAPIRFVQTYEDPDIPTATKVGATIRLGAGLLLSEDETGIPTISVGDGASSVGGIAAPPITARYWASQYFAGAPSAFQVVFAHVMGATVVFPANLVGSYGRTLGSPPGTTVFNVLVNGAPIGTLTLTPASVTGTFTTIATTVSAGSLLTIVAPIAPDAGLPGLIVTLMGTVSS